MLRCFRPRAADQIAPPPAAAAPPSPTDAAPLLCDYLAPPDVAQLRLVCRDWRAAVDKRTTHLAAFAPPPPDASRGLLWGVRTLSCALPPLQGGATAPRGGGGGGYGGGGSGTCCRATAPRGWWVAQLAAALPDLASLQLQCSLPGVDDLRHLSRLAGLSHLTLLECPLAHEYDDSGSDGSNGSGRSGGSAAARAVVRCAALRTLCLQSTAQPMCLRSDLAALAPLTALTRLHLQPGSFHQPQEAQPGFLALAALTSLQHLLIVPSMQVSEPVSIDRISMHGGVTSL
jgi:hypothetical protein